MWPFFIVVIKPASKLRHHRLRIWPIIAKNVIPFLNAITRASAMPLPWVLHAGVNLRAMPNAAAKAIVFLAL